MLNKHVNEYLAAKAEHNAAEQALQGAVCVGRKLADFGDRACDVAGVHLAEQRQRRAYKKMNRALGRASQRRRKKSTVAQFMAAGRVLCADIPQPANLSVADALKAPS